MCKGRIFLEQILFQYLPDMFPTKTSQQMALSYPKGYNIEHLVEIAMSKVGGYQFVDAEGYDFDDFSDSKTTTVNTNTKTMTISSVETKIGALRICCYNPHNESIDFFFVPASRLDDVRLSCYGKDCHKQRILARYNEPGNHYNQFEEFRVPDFKTLAMIVA